MNNHPDKYSGVWPVMVTPFDRSGDIDLKCYEDLLEISKAHGVLCLGDSLLRHGYPETAKYILKKIGFNILTQTRVREVKLSEDVRKLIDCGMNYILENI